MSIIYSIEETISAVEFVNILQRSGLAERSPIGEPDRIFKMIDNANLFITARDGKRLVGIARSLTDFSFICYLSDLAVDREYQKSGIGRKLMELTKEKAGCRSILLSAPGAMDYYAKIGLAKLENAFDFTEL